jgi:DNA-directed RNA polymerase subunit RPC12/RpoP
MKKEKDLYGINGWLSFFVFILFSIGTYHLLFGLWELFGQLLDRFPTSFSVMVILCSAAPLYILNQLYARNQNIISLTRKYILAFPFIWAFWDMFLAQFNFTQHIINAILISIALNVITFTIPWYIYFAKSKRAKNTFGYEGKPMPEVIKCPNCGVEILLYPDEQRNKPVTCPACRTEVNKVVVKASLEIY